MALSKQVRNGCGSDPVGEKAGEAPPKVSRGFHGGVEGILKFPDDPSGPAAGLLRHGVRMDFPKHIGSGCNPSIYSTNNRLGLG